MKKNAMKDAFSDISNQSEATTTLAVAVIREWIARWWECYTNGWEPYVGDFIIGDLTWLDDKINQNMADATDEAVEDWIEEKIEDVIQDIDPNAI